MALKSAKEFGLGMPINEIQTAFYYHALNYVFEHVLHLPANNFCLGK